MHLFRTVFCVLALWLALARAQPLEVTMVAGRFNEPGRADGVGGGARFSSPAGVAVDGAGNVFVTDSGNAIIRKITPARAVTTVAGRGIYGYGDGVGSAATFYRLRGIVVDPAGVLYVADGNTIRRVSPAGAVTTLAGRGGVNGWRDGVGGEAVFGSLEGLALDAAGNLYAADPTNSAVRRITPSGVVTTVYRDSLATGLLFRRTPQAIAFDRAGNLYFTDWTHGQVCRLTPGGTLTEFAGNREWATVDGHIGSFVRPTGLVSDGADNLYVTDALASVIRVVTPERFVTTLAGLAGVRGGVDGTGLLARFDEPVALARDAAGTLYIADRTHTLRKAAPGDAAAEALTPAGSLWGMGYNTEGQLGGAPLTQGVPVRLATNVIAASAGSAHTLYITGDRTLWAMGTNWLGQLGDGTRAARALPVPVASEVIAVEAGVAHSLFLKADGTLWAMGANAAGQLGDGTTTDRTLPVQVATGVTAMAAGSSHSLFLREDGSLWGMGSNGFNQLDQTTTTHYPSPIRVASDVMAVAAGGAHTAYIAWDGTLWALGANRYGQIGDGAAVPRATLAQVATQVYAVAAGGEHTMFLKIDGTLWAMGDDRRGQLGDGWPGSDYRPTPVQIASDVAAIDAYGNGGVYVKKDGSAWGVGEHATGDNRHVPVRFANGINHVAQGGVFSLFLAGTPPPPPFERNPGRLTNFSVLAPLAAAGDSFSLGYVVSGPGGASAKPVVVRAAGPSLAALGVAGTLADPKLELFAGAIKLRENDNWGGVPALTAAMAAVGAFPFTSATSLDAAIAVTGATRDNSVRVSAGASAPGGTGAVIVEVYDATPRATFTASTPRLVNFSVLKNVGPGITLGFVLAGTSGRPILLRAIGPALGSAPFNLAGTLADPRIELFDSAGRSLGANDNWGGAAALASAFGQTGAFTLPATSRDAALALTLAPGSYTAVVTPAPGTATGTALLEVYEVP